MEIRLGRRSGAWSSIDSLHACAWVFFFLLAFVALFLPLSPHVLTLGERPQRPPPPDVEEERKPSETDTKSGISAIIKDAVGCNKTDPNTGKKITTACDIADAIDSLLPTPKGQAVPETTTPPTKEVATRTELHDTLEFDILPRYKASCWMPAQFTESHGAYTSTICSNLMNGAIRGHDVKSDHASIYFIDMDVPIIPRETEDREPSTRDRRFAKLVEKMISSDVYTSREDYLYECHDLTSKSTPLMLFVFSLLLVLPQLVWTCLSAGWCKLNVDKTVDGLRAVQNLPPDSRHAAYMGVVRETPASSSSSAVLYLACKAVCCVVSFAELVYTAFWLLPRLSTLSDNFSELSDFARAAPLHLQDFLQSQCFYSIRQIQNVHDYTVSCLYHQDSVGDGSAVPSVLTRAENTAAVYNGLFTIVCAFLVLHLFTNFLGTAGWLVRLCACSTSPTDAGKAPLSFDIRLLVCLTQEQLGHVDSRELAKCFHLTPADTSPGKGGHNEKGNLFEETC